MKKFNIKCPSEKKMRQFAGENVQLTEVSVEMTPFTFLVNKKMVLKAAPMTYVANLKEFIFKRLKYLDR